MFQLRPDVTTPDFQQPTNALTDGIDSQQLSLEFLATIIEQAHDDLQATENTAYGFETCMTHEEETGIIMCNLRDLVTKYNATQVVSIDKKAFENLVKSNVNLFDPSRDVVISIDDLISIGRNLDHNIEAAISGNSHTLSEVQSSVLL